MFESCRKCTPETGRYPGCHDHCERHAQEKAEYYARKAIVDERKHIDSYSCGVIVNAKDAEAKRKQNYRRYNRERF